MNRPDAWWNFCSLKRLYPSPGQHLNPAGSKIFTLSQCLIGQSPAAFFHPETSIFQAILTNVP
jgi:hypothetical protein